MAGKRAWVTERMNISGFEWGENNADEVYSGRWAMIFDKDGKVVYAENEKSPGDVSVRRDPVTAHGM